MFSLFGGLRIVFLVFFLLHGRGVDHQLVFVYVSTEFDLSHAFYLLLLEVYLRLDNALGVRDRFLIFGLGAATARTKLTMSSQFQFGPKTIERFIALLFLCMRVIFFDLEHEGRGLKYATFWFLIDFLFVLVSIQVGLGFVPVDSLRAILNFIAH